MTTKPTPSRKLVRMAVAYDDATPTPPVEGEDADDTITFELPEDLSAVEDDTLGDLLNEAVEAFGALHDPDGDLTDEDVAAMEQLAQAAEAIRAEQGARAEQREANRAQADELARRVNPENQDGEQDGEGDGDDTDTEATDEDQAEGDDAEGDEGGEPQATDDAAEGAEDRELVTAGSGRRTGPLSVTIAGVRRRQSGQAPRDEGQNQDGPTSLVASGDLRGYREGQPISLTAAAEGISDLVAGINAGSYRAAFSAGRRLTNSVGVLSLRKHFPDELVASADNAMDVLSRAVDESRLPGGSLVAAGGWCAPSETDYGLAPEVESAEGLVSVPEVGVTRGGMRFTKGPNFASLFADTGFSFTEEDDEGGLYEPGTGEDAGSNVEGPKPCFKVECEDFEEVRLDVVGLCVTAGLLQNRAYPELTERTIRGALVAHQHRTATRVINEMAAGSDAVAMPADQVGALAPVLTAIELQVEHYRYVHRAARSTTLEAIFPYWTRGVIRSDLSRRIGVPVENITNAVIGQHFAERGVNVQFVYNYQDISGDAADFTVWPDEVRFLLYAAGTWVRGSSDLITLEAIFDSALLQTNDFTALFSEEGILVAKRGHDSREVTVPISATGHTAGGVEINHDGSAGGA